MFDGDWHLALASYNGGPGRVAARDEAGRSRRLLEAGLAAKTLLPRETRDYVPMILAAIVIARNPAQYGFEFESPSHRSLTTQSVLARPSRPPPRRRVDRHDHRRDSGAQPGAPPLDDAGARRGV